MRGEKSGPSRKLRCFTLYTRCVRRAFLCGDDPPTGKDFDHRKQWVEQRLQELNAAMALDICDFCRDGQSPARRGADAAGSGGRLIGRAGGATLVATFSKRRDEQGRPTEPEEHKLGMLQADPQALAERRRRLSSLSWFMRWLSEPLTRRANKEDEVSGRFFEGRSECQKLLDEAAILACSVYVDLNPVRAGMAEAPKASAHTSAYEQIQGRQARGEASATQPRASGARVRAGRRPTLSDRDGWLCPG